MSNSSWYIWDARVRESTLKTTALEINKIPIIMHSTFKVIYLLYFADLVIINPITLFRIDLFEAAHGWRAREGGVTKRPPFPKICHTYPTKMKLGTVIPYLKKTEKKFWITWHIPWVQLTSVFFHWKSAKFAISENTNVDCILVIF